MNGRRKLQFTLALLSSIAVGVRIDAACLRLLPFAVSSQGAFAGLMRASIVSPHRSLHRTEATGGTRIKHISLMGGSFPPTWSLPQIAAIDSCARKTPPLSEVDRYLVNT